MHHVHAGTFDSQKKASENPELEYRQLSVLWNTAAMWQVNLGPLQELCVLLTVESSQSRRIIFKGLWVSLTGKEQPPPQQKVRILAQSPKKVRAHGSDGRSMAFTGAEWAA